ncbi:MAG TPA: DUF695 domain-containing protein [Kofleriaceae bacterium]
MTRHWDFYQCQIDDAPASIFLDLRFEHETRPPHATTLFRIRVQMLDPDEHGMGTASEATAFNALEDDVVTRATAAQLSYVGRIRSGAIWELVFYGGPEAKDALEVLRKVFVDRRTYVDMRPDPDWGYYRDFLLPDDERREWMEDRKVVEALADHGDSLAIPRRIDHWIYFATAEARDQFIAEATQRGFAVEDTGEREGELPFVVQLHRVDSATLDHIHEVVMELFELATSVGGEYDGWESPALTTH